MNIPSKDYRDWHETASFQILAQHPKKLESGSSVCITIYSADKRPADLTNKAESIMDLLVDMGILEDDNWFVCPRIYLEFGGVDKLNPRAIVNIP